MVLNIRHGIKTAGISWPDASTTGPSGALTAVPGSATSGTGWSWDNTDKLVNVTSSSITISNLDVAGCILINGKSDVTISNCRASWASSVNDAGIFGISSNNLTVVDCEVVGPGPSNFTGGYSAIRNDGGTGFHVQRCEVSGAENGIFHSGLNGLIEDSYIHDLIPEDIFGDPNGAGAPHTDGCQLTSSNECNGTTVRHNNIISSTVATSAIIMGSVTNMTITNNRLYNGTYTLYIWNDATNVFTNNRIYGGVSGLVTTFDSAAQACTWSGNVNDVTGATIPYPN